MCWSNKYYKTRTFFLQFFLTYIIYDLYHKLLICGIYLEFQTMYLPLLELLIYRNIRSESPILQFYTLLTDIRRNVQPPIHTRTIPHRNRLNILDIFHCGHFKYYIFLKIKNIIFLNTIRIFFSFFGCS